MGYFNYHAKLKRKIKEGELIKWEVVNQWNKISPALVLYFTDCPPMPVREYRFEEYFELLEKLNLL